MRLVYVDNIHSGEGETQFILFPSKRKVIKLQKLEIIYNNIQIMQQSRAAFLCYILKETISGESMTHKVISKVNTRLKLLHKKIKYITPNLRCLLCNILTVSI